jgi:hypothetical protein
MMKSHFIFKIPRAINVGLASYIASLKENLKVYLNNLKLIVTLKDFIFIFVTMLVIFELFLSNL